MHGAVSHCARFRHLQDLEGSEPLLPPGANPEDGDRVVVVHQRVDAGVDEGAPPWGLRGGGRDLTRGQTDQISVSTARFSNIQWLHRWFGSKIQM